MGASRRQIFRQADVSRALKAAQSAGLPIARVEIDQAGKIVIDFGKAEQDAQPDYLAAWKAKHGEGALKRRQ